MPDTLFGLFSTIELLAWLCYHLLKLAYQIAMNSSKKAIMIETVGVVIFVVLCNSNFNIPTFFLVGFLFCLQVGLIWMAVTILKDTRTENNNRRVL
jgi:hypothetical protein